MRPRPATLGHDLLCCHRGTMSEVSINELKRIEGSDKRRFFAVLHLPPVTSPVEAVRAAIVAEQRK